MKVFFSVGEASGDQHAANLIRELRRQQPDVRVEGLGGDLMVEAGMKRHANTVDRAVMFLHSLKRIPELRRLFREVRSHFASDPPDVVVLVDSIGFNLYVAHAAKACGLPVVYYISPQLWAHGSWRVKKLRRYVDRMIVIYPFEVDFYTRHGMDAVYVGHPLFDELGRQPLDSEVVARTALPPGKRQVGILPGSRRQEIENLLPILIAASRRIKAEAGQVQFRIALSGHEHMDMVERTMAAAGVEWPYEVGKASEVIAGSDLCLVSSGTATLQTAYFAKPMVIVYRVSPLFYFFAKPFVATPFIGLTNVLAGRQIVPELVLTNDRCDAVAAAAIELLTDHERYDRCVRDLTELREEVAQVGASERAAAAVLDFLAGRPCASER